MNREKLPEVSVVLPIYNTEKYLSECIESLIRQTYSPIEIILVDDGSTDSSGKICDYYASKNPIIKVIHTNNQERTKTRITGVEQASGEYVTLVDSDDFVAPTYVEHLMNCLLEYNVDISCCQSFNVYGEKKTYIARTENGRFDKKEIERILTKNFLFDERSGIASIPHYLCCKLFKKEMLYQLLPLGLNLWSGEDVVSVFSLLKRSNSIFVSKEPLYYYRQHESQTTKSVDREYWDATTKAFKTLKEIDCSNYLEFQMPLFILNILRDWLKARFEKSNSYCEFKSDMAYALDNETIDKLFIHKRIITTNIRHRILAFLAQHKLFFIYYMFMKAHIAVLKKKEGIK